MFIHSQKGKPDIPDFIQYKDVTANAPEDICNLFSRFFSSVFEPTEVSDDFDVDSIPDLNLTSDLLLSNASISKDNLLRELRKLDASKGSGIDNIPPIFLKHTAYSLLEPIHYIFNRCLSEGVFPSIWKSARIVPVHKGGSKNDVENYRPISILPAISKVFESVVHKLIYPSLHTKIIEQQHGFVQNRSTTTNLLIYTSYLFEALDANKQTDSIYTDFRKAFDRVDHKILLYKLAFNGIRGNLWRWFKSYISNRTQKVVVNGFESAFVPVTSGVPQGSILGPLLFVLFINDVFQCFQFCNILLYADDLKIFHCINNPFDHIKIQEDLDRFSAYCIRNKLNLSLNKCKVISFVKKKTPSKFQYSLCGVDLLSTDTIKDLGITLDSKLHLDSHIENIVNRAYKMYGFVMRTCSKFTRSSTLIYIYKSLIRSQLEYAVSVWNPYYNKYIESIESVQKKFLRHVNYKFTNSYLPYQNLLRKYNILSLQSRRIQLNAQLLYDICHGRYDCIPLNNKISYNVPRRAHTRRHLPPFATGKCRTNAGKRSPMYQLTHTYNVNLSSIDILSCPLGHFKNLLKQRFKQ